ncbi:hypothetical protein [Actinoplanes sp. NPDC049265]|uniref:hypothetical protein n=1 Tax=Actinoplanes sp. NPDC049265 TaxID=3363902 RepID=UPI00371983BF
MMDLQNRLERLAGADDAVPAGTIEKDLGRGRRAVQRRRTVQAVAGSAFGVAAIATAFTFGGVSPSGPDAGAAPPPVTYTAGKNGGLKLVDYRGEQPKWFTVDKVPKGYFIQYDDGQNLTIAPEAAKNVPAGTDPSKSPMYDPRVLTGKIGVYLEKRGYRAELHGDKVTVAGRDAVLNPVGGGTMQLVMSVSDVVYATIQFDVPMGREQMIEMGAGLHVSQDGIDQMAKVKGKNE